MTDNRIQSAPSAYSYPLLIKNLFLAPVAANPEQEIVYKDTCRFTYAQFHQRVRRLANALTELGVRPGDTVGVMDWDSHRYLECYYAVPMLGAVLHMINTRFSPEQILYTIDHAKDDFLLVHAEFLPILEQIKGRIDSVRHYILIQDDAPPPSTSLTFSGEYEELLEKNLPTFHFPEFDENTRATTFYTTGTTGMPKGVYFSHRQLVLHTLGAMAAFASSAEQGRFHQKDVYMPITPMFHVHAWGIPFVATALGVKQVYPGKYAPNILLQLIQNEGVTFSHSVPTVLSMLMASPEFDKVDLSKWKVVIGGSALPKKICQAAREKGIDIFTGYGMSETCPILTISQVGDAQYTEDEETEIRCKAGRPLPLVQLRIVDEQMQDVAKDGTSVGEIIVRSPWLTQGYWKDSRNSEILWKNGYLHTGDVANIDAMRYVHITDRMKDVIKIGGEWLSSLELEDVINLHPLVSEVAVIGIPHEKWGEKPLALIVVKANEASPRPREIIRHIKAYIDKGRMSKTALLTKIQYVETIDKTSVGKLDKKALRKKFVFPSTS